MSTPPQTGDIVRELCGGRHARTARVVEVLPSSLRMIDLTTGEPIDDDPEWWTVVVSPIRLR